MVAIVPIEPESGAPAIILAGETLRLDASGAIYWPAAATLAVADLHLEKGTSYGSRGITLPPYDTAATLALLADALARFRPRRVVCLGDSFHDGGAAERIDPLDRAALAALVALHDWYWVTGNHDPHPPALGGHVVGELTIGALSFRHQADPMALNGEISGHFHPKATWRANGRRIGGRCFVHDGNRLILPAFGAYAGGLDVGDPAIGRLFPAGRDTFLIARGRVTRLPHR
jgi:uncharacterized protein